MNEKRHLKYESFIENVITSINKRRCGSDNISCDNENLLLVAAFYTPISSFWEGPLQNSVFSTHSYQIILASEKAHFSGLEGKHPVVLVM